MKIVVYGGNKLHGEVEISGAKNSALPCLIATLLTTKPCKLHNIPKLLDVDTTIQLLETMGKNVKILGHTVYITEDPASAKKKRILPFELMSKMRASILVMGPLLARYGEAIISYPGGCAIGLRPIDIHLSGFQHFGANIDLSKGYIHAKCEKKKKEVHIVFRYPSVGATENIMMYAALHPGTTIIENAALEPEIVDLATLLNNMGAKIQNAGEKTITIEGVEELHGTEHTIIPDRIETGTFLIAALVTRSTEGVTLLHTNPSHLTTVIEKLRECGANIKVDNDKIFVSSTEKLSPVDIETNPYPGFPTDLQAQWTVLMSTIPGTSVIKETIFENRFLHIPELLRMGMNIKVHNQTVIVHGVEKFSGATVVATDLRASSALILAGLAVPNNGKTEILEIHHLDRGYERIERKLRKIGAKIYRRKD
jgi:UDP-N-acetylglucosamine 1-carboxyvinyltransferase